MGIAARFPGLTALVVEDNLLIGEITVARLARLVGAVIWAQDGIEGLRLYEAHGPDVVLVDELLPHMRGSELVAEIRKRNRSVLLIGITASTLGHECSDLLAAGADIALEKPLGAIQLAALISEIAAGDDGGPKPAI